MVGAAVLRVRGSVKEDYVECSAGKENTREEQKVRVAAAGEPAVEPRGCWERRSGTRLGCHIGP